MELYEKVKTTITENLKKSNGSCGIYIPDLSRETEIEFDVLKPILKQLYTEKFFVLREGLNGKMIFKK